MDKGLMKSGLAAALALVGTAALAPAASAQEYNESSRIESFDAANLMAGFKMLGVAYQQVPRDNGTVFFNLTFPNGARAAAWTQSCTGGHCKGLMLVSYYNMPQGKSPAQIDAILRDFNDREAIGKAYRAQNGQAVMQHYVMSFYGIPMGNVLTHLVAFSDAALGLHQGLNGP